MSVIGEGVKAVGGIVDAMRSNPLAIANILLNICFLVFLIYYVSIIASRAQTVVAGMFAANDKLYAQWGTIIKDQNALTEKAMHCLLPEDALKLLQLPPRSYAPDLPARPAPPAPLEPQRQSFPPRWLQLGEPVFVPSPDATDLFKMPP